MMVVCTPRVRFRVRVPSVLCRPRGKRPRGWPRPRLRRSIIVSIGGSWVLVSGVLGPLIWGICIVTLLITAHEPPSRSTGSVEDAGSGS